MTDADRSHPEVFTAAVPVPDNDGRTVYPPRPDADGLYALSEVLDWDTFMNQTYVQLRRGCSFARSALSSLTLSVESAGKAQDCVRQIESILPWFLRRELFLIPEQQRLKDVCGMLFSEIMVWAGLTDCLQMYARFIAGSADKWLSLSQALVENHLEKQKDWRHARAPVHWVKRVTNNIDEKESWLTWNAIDRSKEPDVISLEEIARTPLEGLLERRYSHHSLTELEAAAKEDPETAEYLACKIHNPSWGLETISRHLNWDKKRGQRVDRRYRRLRKGLRDRGMGLQCREYRPPVGISEANFTVHFEQLFDGARGRGVGVWQHHQSGH